MVASTAGTPHYRPSSPGGRTTPAGKFGEADPVGQRRLHDVEAMLRDSNLKVDRLTSKLTGSHQEVQRLRTHHTLCLGVAVRRLVFLQTLLQCFQDSGRRRVVAF